MSDHDPVSRRTILGTGLAVAGGLFARRLAGEAPTADDCATRTPAQAEGPFYPTRDRPDEDADLTRVAGRSGRAKGQVIRIGGRVLDQDCKPVAGALVEVWQANAAGRYDHEGDAKNPRPLDPDFQSWAELLTGADGGYAFTSIKPGAYPANDQGWIRPPHIHFKVSKRGYHELITQLYFAGEPLNEPDLLRKELSPEEQKRVTIALAPTEGALAGTFDITLRAVG